MDIYERLNKMDKRYRRYHWFVMRAFVRTVRRHLTGRRAKRILDVGTGTGTAAIRIRELLPGSLVCGLDKNELLIRLASEKSGASTRWAYSLSRILAASWPGFIPPCALATSFFWGSRRISLLVPYSVRPSLWGFLMFPKASARCYSRQEQTTSPSRKGYGEVFSS